MARSNALRQNREILAASGCRKYAPKSYLCPLTSGRARALPGGDTHASAQEGQAGVGLLKRRAATGLGRAVLNKKKKVLRYTVFLKKRAGTPCVQAWSVAVGGWQLAAIGGRHLATRGWWWSVIGRRWQLAVVGSGWRLVVGGGWRLVAVGASWSLGAVLKGGS